MNGQEEKLDQVAIISTKTDRHSFLVQCKMPLATGGKGRTIKDAKTKDKRRNVYA